LQKVGKGIAEIIIEKITKLLTKSKAGITIKKSLIIVIKRTVEEL